MSTPTTKPGTIDSIQINGAAGTVVPPFRFINPTGGLCGAGVHARGVLKKPTLVGNWGAITLNGIELIESGAAISANASVISDATGRAVTGGLGGAGEVLATRCGIVLDAATAAGQFIRLQVLL